MESGGHIWEERISTNLFLTHYLVRGIEMICLDQTQKGNGVFKGEKNYKRKTCFTKCSLWKIFS